MRVEAGTGFLVRAGNGFIQTLLIAAIVVAMGIGLARADEVTDAVPRSDLADQGKLLATGGVSQVEGAGGGGLGTWALITGYGSRDSIGANAHYTYVDLPNFTLRTAGVSVGLFDRLELSFARMSFDTGTTGGKLGLGNGFTFDQDVVGAKMKVWGDAVYDQDRWMPQIAIGTQWKTTNQAAVLRAVGARSNSGIDYYLAASKLFLAESLLVNATIRETRANQFGILGFGGDKKAGYSTQFEGSAAYLLSRNLAIGAEYRTKPDNLGFAKEENAYDLFLAWFLNKHVSATLAFVALGDIATQKNQNGAYLSIQAGF